MTWNYRIIKDTHTYNNGKTYPRYGVYEVFYNDDGSIMTCSQDPEELSCVDDTDEDALNSLKWTIKKIAEDIEKHPVLDIADIPGCGEEE